jgi:rod shape-determining protein MreD
VVAVLVAAHFYLRPRLGDPRFAPDFILVAFLFLATRSRAAVGAAAGFLVGILTDAVGPTAFGAAALAFTIVGFLAGLATTLFVADNALVTGLFVLAAAWLRDAIQVLASNQLRGGALAWQLFVGSPLAALSTAALALLAFLVFRPWLGARRTR